MYYQAYSKTNLLTETPAQTEYRLFAEITREMEIANSAGATPQSRINALFRNSQLWLTLKTDLCSEGNKLDTELKASLISLALWVDRFTAPAMRSGCDLAPIIAVNKQIMEGLSGAAKTARTARKTDTAREFSQASV
jgi:flagellar protein FlaF